MELSVPVEGGEIWAEDTGGDGPPVLLAQIRSAVAAFFAIGGLVR